MSIWLDVKYKLKSEDRPTEYEILYGEPRNAFQNFTKSALEKITGEEIEDGIHDTYGFGKKYGVNFNNQPNPNRNGDTVRTTDPELIALLAEEYYYENKVEVTETIVKDPKGVNHLCLQYKNPKDDGYDLNVGCFHLMDIKLPTNFMDWNWGWGDYVLLDPWGVIYYSEQVKMITKEFNPELYEKLEQFKNHQLLFGHPIEDIEWIEYALV